MTDLDEEVRILALNIAEGETKNGLRCPKCGGGIHGDRAFSITRTGEGSLKYICFRASCGFRGGTASNGGVYTRQRGSATRTEQKTPEYTNTSFLDRHYLHIKYYGISNEFIRSAKRSRDGLIFFCFDASGRRYGVLEKKILSFGWDGSGPKSILYEERDVSVKGDWSLADGSTSDVIVTEDMISADCVNNVCGVDTYALNGSELTDNAIVELKKTGYENILIALDPDAWGKADKLEQKYSLLGVRALKWDNDLDPKDMSIEQLKQLYTDDKFLRNSVSAIPVPEEKYK